jgi:hypothetical protein
MENTMKYLIKFLAIIGLVSMSHVAVAQSFPVVDGDVLTADMVNEFHERLQAEEAEGLDFDIEDLPACLPANGLAVGDAGEAGGIVFFVTADGCNGLEAAPVDQSGGTIWGCDGVDLLGAAGSNIGDGAPNTYYIINADPACIPVADAAEVARAYTGGGEDDWYLPSRDELVEMYNTIGPASGFSPDQGFLDTKPYWSSTEVDETDVIVVDFTDGKDGNVVLNPKTFSRAVRAIRTINVEP